MVTVAGCAGVVWCGVCGLLPGPGFTDATALFQLPRYRPSRTAPVPPQDTFIFRVEGTGVLPPQDIVLTACEVLASKIRNLDAALAEEARRFDGREEPAPMQA